MNLTPEQVKALRVDKLGACCYFNAFEGLTAEECLQVFQDNPLHDELPWALEKRLVTITLTPGLGAVCIQRELEAGTPRISNCCNNIDQNIENGYMLEAYTCLRYALGRDRITLEELKAHMTFTLNEECITELLAE